MCLRILCLVTILRAHALYNNNRGSYKIKIEGAEAPHEKEPIERVDFCLLGKRLGTVFSPSIEGSVTTIAVFLLVLFCSFCSAVFFFCHF